MATSKKLEHLEWAVGSRYKIQLCSLRLLTLFTVYEAKWKTQSYARAAQDLIAVAFSLWRAAFLAEKESKREVVFTDGVTFLQTMIETNSIAFGQDRASNEWTFNYYARNARYALQVLEKYWPEQVSKYVGGALKATDRWDYCHGLLDEAVTKFDEHMREKKAEADHEKATAERRKTKKENRKTVRKMTLAERKKA